MTTSPLTDVVSSQYERWMYPEPILDIGKWLISNWQWFDPSHAHPVLWPDGGCPEELDILVAGCGTNQAAVLAYTNPKARIAAIDVSGPSLDHHRFLKARYGLKNLEPEDEFARKTGLPARLPAVPKTSSNALRA